MNLKRRRTLMRLMGRYRPKPAVTVTLEELADGSKLWAFERAAFGLCDIEPVPPALGRAPART